MPSPPVGSPRNMPDPDCSRFVDNALNLELLEWICMSLVSFDREIFKLLNETKIAKPRKLFLSEKWFYLRPPHGIDHFPFDERVVAWCSPLHQHHHTTVQWPLTHFSKEFDEKNSRTLLNSRARNSLNSRAVALKNYIFGCQNLTILEDNYNLIKSHIGIF